MNYTFAFNIYDDISVRNNFLRHLGQEAAAQAEYAREASNRLVHTQPWWANGQVYTLRWRAAFDAFYFWVDLGDAVKFLGQPTPEEEGLG